MEGSFPLAFGVIYRYDFVRMGERRRGERDRGRVIGTGRSRYGLGVSVCLHIITCRPADVSKCVGGGKRRVEICCLSSSVSVSRCVRLRVAECWGNGEIDGMCRWMARSLLLKPGTEHDMEQTIPDSCRNTWGYTRLESASGCVFCCNVQGRYFWALV